MKKLLIPAMLLAAASSYGALAPATGGRLTDYTNWFAPEFNVASDANYVGIPYPRNNVPNAVSMDTVNRDWSGWSPNFPVGLTGPYTGQAGGKVKIEALFLGETAGWWDDWGYNLNGTDYLLADGIQAVGGLTRKFGDYVEFLLNPTDTLDFFVVGTQNHKQDGVITTPGSQGGKYYMFNKAWNTPAGATNQSYFGFLTPLTSVRGPEFLGDENGALPFTVTAFEDINLRSNSDRDYNDILFASRVGGFIPNAPVPEPSTYGLIGAAALLGLAGYRRFKKA
jgi:hypothetical protein